jgi:putative oxidoreductase
MFKKLFTPSEDSDLTSMALLVARLWFGLAMLFNHGLDKFAHFKDIVGTFPDPLGLGKEASLVLVIFAEVLAALLLAVGLFTRLAAAVLVIDMFVAFLMVHKTAMSGGELAFLYLAGYVVLLIAGGGLFSLDTVAFHRNRVQK